MKIRPWKIILLGDLLQLAFIGWQVLKILDSGRGNDVLVLIISIVAGGVMLLLTLLYLIKPIVRVVGFVSIFLGGLGVFLELIGSGGYVFIIPSLTFLISGWVSVKKTMDK